MGTKDSEFKIDESTLMNDAISPEQHLLEAIFYNESRESALKKAENIVKCILEEDIEDFFPRLNNVIKSNPIGPLTLFAILIKHNEIEVSYRAKMLANIRLINDPKQIALKEISEHYKGLKEQFKRRGFTAQFIREMAQKYPIITDQKTIANLVSKLNKENIKIPR